MENAVKKLCTALALAVVLFGLTSAGTARAQVVVYRPWRPVVYARPFAVAPVYHPWVWRPYRVYGPGAVIYRRPWLRRGW